MINIYILQPCNCLESALFSVFLLQSQTTVKYSAYRSNLNLLNDKHNDAKRETTPASDVEEEEGKVSKVEHKYIIIDKDNTETDKVADNAVVNGSKVDYNTVLARDVACPLECEGMVELLLAPLFITFSRDISA